MKMGNELSHVIEHPDHDEFGKWRFSDRLLGEVMKHVDRPVAVFHSWLDIVHATYNRETQWTTERLYQR